MLDRNIYDLVLNDEDSVSYKTIKRMVKTITNFARTGYVSMKFLLHWDNIWICAIHNSSDPSIEGDTFYERIESPHEIFIQEITNHPKSTVTTNIVEQLHYDTWREVETIYKSLT